VAAGCATPAVRPAFLPVPPAETLRSSWGTVAVVGAAGVPRTVWQQTPGKGAGAAAAAFNGAAYTTAVLAQGGNGYGVILGVLVSPATALIGAGVGAIKAEPAAVVQQHREVLDQAFGTVNWPVMLSQRVGERARAQTNQVLLVNELGDATTILEVAVTDLGLLSPAAANPVLQFVMAAETKLRRRQDNVVLYENRLLYFGHACRLADWARDGAARWRQDVEQGTAALAGQVAEEVFFLYLMKDSRE